MIKAIPLKSLYALRKHPSLTPRTVVARTFHYKNLLGLEDHNCMIWPIAHSELLPPGYFIQATLSSQNGLLSIASVDELVDRNPDVHDSFLYELNAESYNENQTHYFPITSKINTIHKWNTYIQRCHAFWKNHGYLQIDTPTLVPSGGMETYIESFQTHYIDSSSQPILQELPTSPEFALKKLLCNKYPPVYSINHSFRNHGELSNYHQPEFTMLEWYHLGASLEDLLNDTYDFIKTLHRALGSGISLKKTIINHTEIFEKNVGVRLSDIQDHAAFLKFAKTKSSQIRDTDSWDDLYSKLFMEFVEPEIQQYPLCFIFDYPYQLAALSRKEGLICKRFETYIYGVEIGNGYHELCDGVELRQRAGVAVKKDPDFFKKMDGGLPPCCGNALGLDRLFMVLTSSTLISHHLPLPFHVATAAF
jgi:lysyl-tRNA synthetase class 2